METLEAKKARLRAQREAAESAPRMILGHTFGEALDNVFRANGEDPAAFASKLVARL